MNKSASNQLIRGLFTVLIVVAVVGYNSLQNRNSTDNGNNGVRVEERAAENNQSGSAGQRNPVSDNTRIPDADDTEVIAQAFAARRSDVWVQASGEVARVLPDDNEGSRHQRFLVELRGGQTILIAHNIDLAPRIPLQRGDTVEFRGEYEYNDKGGVVHWTHHDPRGRKAGGWITHHRKKYD